MSRVAIVIWSDPGQTLKIAHHMRQSLESSGIETQVMNLKWGIRPDFEVDSFDSFIIGAPIATGKFPVPFSRWVSKHANALNRARTAVFAVSLNAASSRWETRAKDERLLKEFVEATRIQPHLVASFADAIHYRQYGPIKRYVMLGINKANGGPTDITKDHDLTKWSDIRAMVDAMKWSLADTAPVGPQKVV